MALTESRDALHRLFRELVEAMGIVGRCLERVGDERVDCEEIESRISRRRPRTQHRLETANARIEHLRITAIRTAVRML